MQEGDCNESSDVCKVNSLQLTARGLINNRKETKSDRLTLRFQQAHKAMSSCSVTRQNTLAVSRYMHSCSDKSTP